jgi:DNA-binding beta-propeller fold protein YncE
MLLLHTGYVELPPHIAQGGFDHAAVHARTGRLYVAHTANDAIDVVDCRADQYLHSIGGLKGVAGALASNERNLVFASNRGEKTVGVFPPDDEGGLFKVPVGIRPNGLAYDAGRNILLAANVGDPATPGSFTVSVVDVAGKAMVASVPVPGRTRWTVFDPKQDVFFVNISDPAQILLIDARDPSRVAGTYSVPAGGPHGLDLDGRRQRIYCACDAKKLVCLDSRSGQVLGQADLSGVPDVVFFNAAMNHLYVAIGDPGVIDVFDAAGMRRIEAVPTERGAHTMAFDADRNKVYAFLPQTHQAAVYVDEG